VDKIRIRRGGREVILEDDGTHAAAFGELRQIDGVDASRRRVGSRMNMDIDDPVEGLVLGRRLAGEESAANQDCNWKGFHSCLSVEEQNG
jgi:hypothetical protein